MLVNQAVQLALLAAAAMLWEKTDAATSSFKICGRQLGEIMARVCHVYNSPTWDVPSVVEQPAVARKRRQAGGIAECCSYGCTLEQLSEYCSVSSNSETLLTGLDTHLIEDRSAEQESNVAGTGPGSAGVGPAIVGRATRVPSIGERRRVESSTRREEVVRSASRAAPVVGTVSPLLTWGRTLYTDLPQIDRDRYAYVAVYST